jgi:hypothetical protein
MKDGTEITFNFGSAKFYLEKKNLAASEYIKLIQETPQACSWIIIRECLGTSFT